MKLYKIYLAFIPILLGMAACTPEPKDDVLEIPNMPQNDSTAIVWVLNEGLFNMNNATLTYFNFTDKHPVQDYFKQQNARGLGDTGNDLQLYGSKMYCIVNVSSQVEVIDPQTGKSIKQIPLFGDGGVPRQPRYIAFDKNKAYVCSFDGTVARIDTASLQVEAVVKVGQNPDGICVANNKLYVSNSGGLNFPDYDNTVSVIDIVSFTEIQKIQVKPNPYRIQADAYGDVYVVSRGNPDEGQYCLQRINSQTDKLEQTFTNLNTLNFTIAGDYAYMYSYNFFTDVMWIKVLNVKTEQIERENFITDGTQLHTPYGINVDPNTGDVYITDAGDFTVTGDVYCFSKEGKLKFKFGAGLNPNSMVFVKKR